MNTHRDWKSYIEEIPDFPKEGISFKDISPLLGDEQAFRSSVVCMGDLTDSAFNKPDVWIGIDARGSSLKAYNTEISNCGLYSVSLRWGGNYSFAHCTFANYWSIMNISSIRSTPSL